MTWRVAGINFDHSHMGDPLRMTPEHPGAEFVGIRRPDRERMASAIGNFAIPEARVLADDRACLEETRPDIAILCPSTAAHADWVLKVAPFGLHALPDKPFAADLAAADRMIAVMEKTGKQFIVNWPLRWYPCRVTARRLVEEGLIGDLIEVHYYDGNRGPPSPAICRIGQQILDSAIPSAREKRAVKLLP